MFATRLSFFHHRRSFRYDRRKRKKKAIGDTGVSPVILAIGDTLEPQSSIGFQPVTVVVAARLYRQDAYATLWHLARDLSQCTSGEAETDDSLRLSLRGLGQNDSQRANRPAIHGLTWGESDPQGAKIFGESARWVQDKECDFGLGGDTRANQLEDTVKGTERLSNGISKVYMQSVLKVILERMTEGVDRATRTDVTTRQL